MVRLAWRSENVEVSMAMVEENLQQCQIKLKWWSRVAFGNIVCKLIDKRQQLKKVEWVAINGGSADRVHQLKGGIRILLSQQEKLWQQRSRIPWLKVGDQNSRYFHSRTSQRFKRNQIKVLKNSARVWCEGEDWVANLMVDFIYIYIYTFKITLQFSLGRSIPLQLVLLNKFIFTC